MQANDVMTTPVVTVTPDTIVRDIARLLLEHRISAVPVLAADGRVVGVVSEGDLMRRAESDTDHRHSWWLETYLSTEERARQYVKTHGRKAADVMTRNVLTVSAESPLREVARLLEKHHIKRVPVVRDGELIGIISRANLLHGLAAEKADDARPSSLDDRNIRDRLTQVLYEEVGLQSGLTNVIVKDGTVQLWGIVESGAERKAAQVAAENTPGVEAVENNLGQVPAWVWAD